MLEVKKWTKRVLDWILKNRNHDLMEKEEGCIFWRACTIGTILWGLKLLYFVSIYEGICLFFGLYCSCKVSLFRIISLYSYFFLIPYFVFSITLFLSNSFLLLSTKSYTVWWATYTSYPSNFPIVCDYLSFFLKYYGLLRYSSSLLRDVFDFEVFVVVFGETGFGSGLEVMGWVMGLYFLEGIVV